MTLNYVTLTLDLYDGQGNPVTSGVAYFTPTAQLTDAGVAVTVEAPVPGVFHAGGLPTVKLLATDNTAPLPNGWAWTVSFTGVSGSPAAFSFFLAHADGASQDLSSLTPVAAPSALLGSIAAGVSVYPSGDTSGATDQAFITGAEATGRTVYFAPGTFYVTGLVKQAGTIWQGSGRLETIIQLANGADTDVVQGANFSTLTLSGSTTGGIGGWGIRDLTIDGNKSNQTGTSHGLRVYGYNFDLSNVSIRNCLSTGLYTEWGNFGQPGPDKSMEARYYGLKIHDGSSHGWHNRGPHDSRAFDVTIWGNGSGDYNYWTESCGVPATVAAGSNGVNVSTFAGAGVLNVNTTLGFPTASISAAQGSLTVVTSGGTAVITYTGVTATTFTGCTTVSGSGTMSTGATVTAAGGGYSANGCLLYGVHGYGGSMAYQYVLDAQNHLIDCIGEVAATASLLLRSNNCVIDGGLYFVVNGASQTGCGLQLGDTTNGIFGEVIRTYVYNFACTSAATAGLNFVNDQGQNDIDVSIYAASGSVLYGGSPNGASASYKIRAYGQATSANEANSLWRERAPFFLNIPSGLTSAYNITQNGTDLLNINVSNSRVEWPNGYLSRWYAGAYAHPTVEISGSAGTLAFGSASGSTTDTTLSRSAASVLQSSGALSAAGITGATATSRYVGATSSGAPASGTFAAGDFVIDQTGLVWVCTAPGSPGTWVNPSAGGIGNTPWTPADNGLLAANASLDAVNAAVTLNPGTLYLLKVPVRSAFTWTKTWFTVSTQGSGASTGSFVGLYSSAGTLLSGSSDIAASLTGTGNMSPSLTTPQALTAGTFVWAAILVNLAVTQPTIRTYGVQSVFPSNLNLGNSALRTATNGTGLTALPSPSITPSSNSSSSATMWIGAS